MKRNYFLLFCMILITAFLSGLLTSGISWVGRVGVNTFYAGYKFFKVWWQSGLVCLVLQLTIAAILYTIDRKYTHHKRTGALTILLLLFLAGFYFTYANFRANHSHRWLGERFHLGVYLYWIGFCMTDLFFIVTAKAPGYDRTAKTPGYEE